MRRRLRQARPLWFDETAISSAGIGEAAQAATLIEKTVFARARGAIGYTWYDLRDDGDRDNDPECRYGLLTRSGAPKQAFVAFNTVVTSLRGTRPNGEIALGAKRHGFIFSGSDRRVAVLWCDDATAAGDIALRVPGCRQATRIDAGGDATAIDTPAATATVAISEQPVLLALPAGDESPSLVR